jgi:hypothetical protein
MSNSSSSEDSSDFNNSLDSSPLYTVHPSSDGSLLGLHPESNQFSDFTTPAQSSSPITILCSRSPQERKEFPTKNTRDRIQSHQQAKPDIPSLHEQSINIDHQGALSTALQVRTNFISPIKITKKPSDGKLRGRSARRESENSPPLANVTKYLYPPSVSYVC